MPDNSPIKLSFSAPPAPECFPIPAGFSDRPMSSRLRGTVAIALMLPGGFRRAMPGFAVLLWLAAIGLPGACAAAAIPATDGGTPAPPARELRCRPDGGDFVITNGTNFFNRALYGGNSGFRIEAGERPEFSLYLPGRGGNLRVGIAPLAGTEAPKWVFDAKNIVARYRAGSMVYEIRDPLLGAGVLTLTALSMAGTEGLVVRAELSREASPVRLIWAFGGVNGDRGRRGGDLKGERDPDGKVVPLSRYFQLKPEYCRGNTFKVGPGGFTLTCQLPRIGGLAPQGGKLSEAEATQWAKPTGVVSGLVPPDSRIAVADASQWATPNGLLASAGKPTATPVVVGEATLNASTPFLMALQKIRFGQTPASAPDQLPQIFADAERRRKEVAGHLVVETPDPFINAAASALAPAADAIWDESLGAYMHGAIAWRIKLLGWRGPYAGDTLGWHDRTRRHLDTFAARQNTSPVPATIPPADEKFNLARNVTALQSNGDMSASLYDMNTVAVDAFFRHVLWTGDLAYAAKMWPVIERHFAWQRRLFRRTFGPDALPLYEAYCCIWASDELIYNGGGATHSSAYNYWHNLMAARVARAIGRDPAPYEKEAGLIRKGMQSELWLSDQGFFGEFKDLLGRQSVHPNPALWTFYHTLDSAAASPMEAWQMSRFVDTGLANIPMEAKGLPAGSFTLATTNWMPYMWSINNVVLAESAHTALAYWQANRPDRAFPLFKGCLLESMFMGSAPGNVGMSSLSDPYSTEIYRDFADGIGVMARALVEGLFGLLPDRLAGVLVVRPGFPADWNNAKIRLPELAFAFARENLKESFSVEQTFSKPLVLRLEIPALRDRVAAVAVNGKPVKWRVLSESVGLPRIEITAPPSVRSEVVVEWQGDAPARISAPEVFVSGAPLSVSTGAAKIEAVSDPQQVLSQPTVGTNGLKALAGGTPGHRTAFLKVAQGDLSWWLPLAFELRPAVEILPAVVQQPGSLKFRVRNNTDRTIQSSSVTMPSGQSRPQDLSVEPHRESNEIVIPADGLLPGSNPVRMEFGNGLNADGVIVNWKTVPSGTPRKFEPVDLGPFFNDRVTQIFLNEYRSPRSPFCSLAIPKQGVGGWCHFEGRPEIDDSGLRAAAGLNGGLIEMPFGVPFRTPGEPDAKNIAFTSQWDNYPREVTVPLSGRATHAYLLMAGSTNPMQSRIDNGEVIVTYTDGTTDRLPLTPPGNWWPIEKDYYIDDFAFARPEPVPPRIELKSGTVRIRDPKDFKIKEPVIPGGVATVLDLPLDPSKELKSLTLRTLANEVVIGVMAVTLAR